MKLRQYYTIYSTYLTLFLNSQCVIRFFFFFFFATAITRVPDRRKKPYITVLKKWKKIPEESDLDSSSESICSFDSEICLAGKNSNWNSIPSSRLLKFLFKKINLDFRREVDIEGFQKDQEISRATIRGNRMKKKNNSFFSPFAPIPIIESVGIIEIFASLE